MAYRPTLSARTSNASDAPRQLVHRVPTAHNPGCNSLDRPPLSLQQLPPVTSVAYHPIAKPDMPIKRVTCNLCPVTSSSDVPQHLYHLPPRIWMSPACCGVALGKRNYVLHRCQLHQPPRKIAQYRQPLCNAWPHPELECPCAVLSACAMPAPHQYQHQLSQPHHNYTEAPPRSHI